MTNVRDPRVSRASPEYTQSSNPSPEPNPTQHPDIQSMTGVQPEYNQTCPEHCDEVSGHLEDVYSHLDAD